MEIGSFKSNLGEAHSPNYSLSATHNSLPNARFPASESLHPLHDRHIGHAAAFAHGLQAVALVALFQCVHQRRHQLGAGAAERMAERDRAAVDIEPVGIGAGGL